jgi:uncharacterized membrane protein
MSLRVYTGPRADRHRGRGGSVRRAIPWLFAVAAIGLQIAFPLVTGAHRRDVVVAGVVAFFLASVCHALIWRGWWFTCGYLVVTVGGGLLVEAVGVRTGSPFGHYRYSTALGRTVESVPWVIPLAWSMFAYPCLVAARRLSRSPLVTPFVGALALASWDLFLDPMMTAEGYWRYIDPTHALPHVGSVPGVDYLGWFLTSLVMMILLDRLPRRHAPDAQPAALFLWVYVSSIVANAFFLHRPWVAFYGAVAMGVVAVPYAWVLWTGRD